jgi:hypothetical protein
MPAPLTPPPDEGVPRIQPILMIVGSRLVAEFDRMAARRQAHDDGVELGDKMANGNAGPGQLGQL